MAGLFLDGGAGQSPWLWLIIPAAAVPLYLFDRSRSRKTGRTTRRIPGVGFAPWWQQAIVFALIGSGSVYRLATGDYRGYWWLIPVAACAGFAMAVVSREPK